MRQWCWYSKIDSELINLCFTLERHLTAIQILMWMRYVHEICSKPKLVPLFLFQTLNVALFLGTLVKYFWMFFYLTGYLRIKIGEIGLVLFQLFFLFVIFSKKLDLFSWCLKHLMQLLSLVGRKMIFKFVVISFLSFIALIQSQLVGC